MTSSSGMSPAPEHATHMLPAHIRQAVTGPMWHGPALDELLADVTVEIAHAHSIPGAHSIWELVLHIAAWAEIVQTRLGMTPTPQPTDAENFPPVPAPTAESWTSAIHRLQKSHEDLASAAAALDRSLLRAEVPGRGYTVGAMLHGVIEHSTYHGGQIAILKRASSTSRGQ